MEEFMAIVDTHEFDHCDEVSLRLATALFGVTPNSSEEEIIVAFTPAYENGKNHQIPPPDIRYAARLYRGKVVPYFISVAIGRI